MCLFHSWIKVEDVNHTECGECFKHTLDTDGKLKGCPHSFKVCNSCGKIVGYGSHGKMTVVPDGCKRQIKFMGGKL